jgi:CRP/FNR family cyclic AMP-dependent transcriptional regulator
LSRKSSSVGALRELTAALDDPDANVRRRAAEALRQNGDRATALLRHRLGEISTASVAAVWVLAHIGSPSARRVLAAYIRQLQEDADRSARLLQWIATAPDRAAWSTLELCLCDHRTRMVDVVLAALAPAIEARLARRLQVALRGSDQRSRAGAFELVAAVPASQRPAGGVALLRSLLFEGSAGAGRPAPRVDGAETVLAEAVASMSPWVRRAAALRAARAPLSPVTLPASLTGPVDRNLAGEHDMELDDQEFDRIIGLKRMALFRYVPFETIAEVARSAQVRTYPAGEEVVAHGTHWQDLLILEAGALLIANGESAQPLTAPACFGEMALAGEPMRWPRITALNDARVSFLRAAIFEELCREHPEIALELCRVLARRLREAGEFPAIAAD